METFNMIVSICSGASVIIALVLTLVKPIREKITHAKERDTKIQGLFNELKADMQKIMHRQNISEKDELRTQLLLLMADYPDEMAEIMKLAEHYFGDLKGNWYCSILFSRFLEEKGIAKPEWFKQD